MKELESSQEVVLLRDAIITAAAQGSDFRSNESSKTCAEILKAAVDEVEMMLGIDCDDPEARILARSKMHELVYYKTMMYSDDLDEAELRYCKYACESLPDICWQTYVRCIKACGWTDLAEEIWNQDTDLVQKVILEQVLEALLDIGVIPDFLDMFYAVLKAQLNSACNKTDATEHTAALVAIGSHLIFIKSFENTISEPIPKQCIVSSVHFLSYFRTHLPATMHETEHAVMIVLYYLVELLKAMLKSTTSPADLDVAYAVENCTETIHRTVAIDAAKQIILEPWSNFLSFIDNMNAGQSEDPSNGGKHLNKYMESITARDVMQEAAVEKLLSSLLSNVDLAVVNCLLLNSDVLKPEQVVALLLRSETMITSDATKLQQIVRKAFLDWDFSAQDSFRGEWHLKYGFKELIFAEMDFPQALTEAANMLSLAGSEKITVAKELSFLCLQSPAVTLNRLFDFGVQNGQADTVAQILGLLKTSFCFVHEGSSFSLSCISWHVTLAELSSQLASLSKLVQALIKMGVLDPAKLLSACVLPNLYPSSTCHRFLQLLWVTLKCSSGLQQCFAETSLTVTTLQLCKLLHYCTTVDLTTVPWDVFELKDRLTAALGLILEQTASSAGVAAVAAHETCWLWTKFDELDPIVLPYVLSLFASQTLESLCMKKIRQMSQPCLLLCCLCQRDKNAFILQECRQRLCLERITLMYTITKILPRLLSSEVQALLQELTLLFGGAEPSVDFVPLVSVMFVLHSLMVLHNLHSLPEQQWNRMAQTCVTSIKAFLYTHQPMPSRALVTLAYVICRLAEESNDVFRATVSIFLMNLLGQAEPLENCTFPYALRAINRLGDEKLTNQAIKTFQSKS